jgi:hypothetical protein
MAGKRWRGRGGGGIADGNKMAKGLAALGELMIVFVEGSFARGVVGHAAHGAKATQDERRRRRRSVRNRRGEGSVVL